MDDPTNELRVQARECIESEAYPLALIHLRTLLKQTPDDPAVHTQLAYCLLQIDERDEAEEFLQRALKINPEHETARQLLTQLQNSPLPEVEKEIVERLHRESLQSAKTERKKTCPVCKHRIPTYVDRCGHCGYRFWKRYVVLWSLMAAMVLFCFIVILNSLGVITEIRDSLPFNQTAAAPASTDSFFRILDIALLFFSIFVNSLVLYGVCVLQNCLERDRAWNHEWMSDLAFSFIIVIISTVCNTIIFMMFNAPMDGMIRQGLNPLMLLAWFGLLLFQLVMFCVLLQRGFFITFGMFFSYLFFSMNASLLIINPVVEFLKTW